MKTDAIHTVDRIHLFEKWNILGIIFDRKHVFITFPKYFFNNVF
jgi:hypothetical protein